MENEDSNVEGESILLVMARSQDHVGECTMTDPSHVGGKTKFDARDELNFFPIDNKKEVQIGRSLC